MSEEGREKKKTRKDIIMENFVNYTPTKVYFGRETELSTGKYIREFGGLKILIVYGGGSAVRSGLLGRIEKSLKAENLEFEEFGGAQPNPTLAHARLGVQKALDMKADFILAVGGGSSIDTAKAIAHGNANPGTDIWDIWQKKIPLVKSTKVAAVLTIPAAGSEMSDSAVLTDEETFQKRGLNTEYNRCVFAVMNPELAMTLPKYQLAAGITDIMMHTMERYFIPHSHAQLTDEIAEGLLRTVIYNGRLVMRDSANYDAMAEIMWASSISHNGLTGLGRPKDFSVHALGQALGGKWNYTHGATLAAVWKAWAEYLYKDEGALPRFARYARNVWHITNTEDEAAAKEGIEATVTYFHELGMPVTIEELGVVPTDKECEELANEATRGGTRTLTQIRPLGNKEAAEIFKLAR